MQADKSVHFCSFLFILLEKNHNEDVVGTDFYKFGRFCTYVYILRSTATQS